MTPKIVVLGATGYTGALIAEALVRRGRAPLLAARDATRLAATAARLGQPPARTVDATDVSAVRGLLAPGDVLVTTVGPFERLGHAAAQAAVDAGAHYVDTTGEVGFVRDLRRRHHDVAREKGVTMLPAFGYDYVPGALAAELALDRGGARATGLRIGYFSVGSMRDGISRGTRATMAEGMLLPSTVLRDGVLQDVRTAGRTREFPVRGRARTGILVSGTEVLFLREDHPRLGLVEDYNGWFPRAARLMPAISAVGAAVAAVPGGRSLIRRAVRGGRGKTLGPDAAQRARSLTHVAALASDDDGAVLAEAHVEGPSAYSLTADLVASAAESLIDGRVDTRGVLSPVQAYGPGGLATLCRDVGLVEVPR